MREPPCIVPVAADDALAWARGELEDRDLLLRSPLTPEAIFLVSLPSLGAYGEALQQCLFWRRKGARAMITRTGTPVVARHLVKNGGVATIKETAPEGVKYRFLVPPAALDAWLHKFGKSQVQSTAAPRQDCL
jgi:hypothetical protein